MSIIYFITHPEVKIEPEKEIGKWNLNEIGKDRINKLSNFHFWDDVAKIYSSPENKTKTAAEMLSMQLGLDLEFHKDLREVDRSSTGFLPEDKYLEKLEEFYSSPETSIDGWESASDAKERIITYIEKLNNHQEIAIVGHSLTGSLLMSYFEKIEINPRLDPGKLGRYFVGDLTHKKLITGWIDY